ncbi:MAG: SMC-Scp complex subunit ScpB [Planctomycetaceae bacterium]
MDDLAGLPATPAPSEDAMDDGAYEPGSTGSDPAELDELEQAYRQALSTLDQLTWGEAGTSADGGQPELESAGAAPPANVSVVIETTTPAGGDRSEWPEVTPAQVIEASLFVGGLPLTAKKLSSLLRGSHDAHAVERAIDELNSRYIAEGRPYEIRLGDGGYRLELRPEHEKLRNRVYGAGPREVRLSQDVLEVLALVAYRQPITQAEIEQHGKENAGNLLRQLLRRDLVAIERGPGGRKNVTYRTTARFLSVFGLGSLAELPSPEDLARR